MASTAAGATEPETSFEDTEKPETDSSNDGRRVLSGNEAIARGAWEAGVVVGAGYPGTPSTEILEALVRLPDVNCEWAPNEKVALEVAVGAAIGGGRALATMKHVGLNVAADPLFSAAYMGVNAGLVVVTADDPGMHSSQNEQDNRLFARAARLPLLEPSTPEEARRFTAAAYELSERYDTPVLLRSTTALSHCRSRVRLNGRAKVPRRPYRKDRVKNVVLPAHGRIRHKLLEDQRMPALATEAESWVELIDGTGELAIITAGPVYLYVREAFPDLPLLKLGMSYPLPTEAVKEFAARHPRILVIEELDPFIEEQVRALGIACERRRTARYGELSVDGLRSAYADLSRRGRGRGRVDEAKASVDAGSLGANHHAVEADPASKAASPDRRRDDEPTAIRDPRSAITDAEAPPLPARPPALCPGCSHRGTFYVLNQKNAIVSGDIGCYTLGALPPLDAMDSCLNMGASISMAHGMEKVMPDEEKQRVVAVIGDSTFYHSGITGLIDIVYNGGASTVVVLDNHTTAMTGHQEHPGTGHTLMGEPAQVVDIEMLAKSVGVKDIRRIDPYDLGETWRTIDDAMRRDEPSLLIADAACVLRERITFGDTVAIDAEKCTGCYACTRVGCPAIEQVDDHLEVNSILCIDCTHCQQVCSDCNAGIDVPQVLELVDQGRYREAFDVLLSANPFPSIAGRVCPHPCDHEVNALGWPQRRLRAQRHPELVPAFPDPHHEGAVSVREMEKFLGDWAIENVDGTEYRPDIELDEHVAVVGSGPGGLSAAWHLRRQGFQVTLFEAQDEPGGMLRYGIPEFRLPRWALDAEIQRLRDIGVDFRCGVRLGTDKTFGALMEEYDAVVLGTGAWQGRDPGIGGAADTPEMLNGVEFLQAFNAGKAPQLGRRVAIIGGGNTAIDCARVARRLGANVSLIYRRTEAEMPAIRDEVDEARQEDIGFHFQELPTRVLRDDEGRFRGLELITMRQGEPDDSGRRRPVPVPGSEHEEALDAVILATGEQPDLGYLDGSDVRRNGRVDVRFTGATSRPGVFAVGDAAFGHGTVTQAVGEGARVADTIGTWLQQRRRP